MWAGFGSSGAALAVPAPVPAPWGLGFCHNYGCLGTGLPGALLPGHWEIIVWWKNFRWLPRFFKRGELPGLCCRSLRGCAVAAVRCEPWGRVRCLGAGSHLGTAGPFPGRAVGGPGHDVGVYKGELGLGAHGSRWRRPVTGTRRHHVPAGLANGRGSGEGTEQPGNVGRIPSTGEGAEGPWGACLGQRGLGLGFCQSSDASVSSTRLLEAPVDAQSLPLAPSPAVTFISGISPAATFPIGAFWSPGTTGLWDLLLRTAWGILAGNGEQGTSPNPGWSQQHLSSLGRVSSCCVPGRNSFSLSLGGIPFLCPAWCLHSCCSHARGCEPGECAGSTWVSSAACGRTPVPNSPPGKLCVPLHSAVSPILIPVLAPLPSNAGTCDAGDPLLTSLHPAAASLPLYGNAGRGKQVWNTRPNSSRSAGCRPAAGA